MTSGTLENVLPTFLGGGGNNFPRVHQASWLTFSLVLLHMNFVCLSVCLFESFRDFVGARWFIFLYPLVRWVACCPVSIHPLDYPSIFARRSGLNLSIGPIVYFCPSVHLFFGPSVYLCPSVHLFIGPSVCPYVHPSIFVHLSILIHCSIRLSLSVCPLVHWSILLSTCPSFYLRPSVYLSIGPFVYLCPSVHCPLSIG